MRETGDACPVWMGRECQDLSWRRVRAPIRSKSASAKICKCVCVCGILFNRPRRVACVCVCVCGVFGGPFVCEMEQAFVSGGERFVHVCEWARVLSCMELWLYELRTVAAAPSAVRFAGKTMPVRWP